MPLRPCLGTPAQRCTRLTARPDSRCPACASAMGQARDARRGTRQARGYTSEHDRLREQWRPKVEAGGVHCFADRCLMPARLILRGQAWDLGHNTERTAWTGPEHQHCNRSAGGSAAHLT